MHIHIYIYIYIYVYIHIYININLYIYIYNTTDFWSCPWPTRQKNFNLIFRTNLLSNLLQYKYYVTHTNALTWLLSPTFSAPYTFQSLRVFPSPASSVHDFKHIHIMYAQNFNTLKMLLAYTPLHVPHCIYTHEKNMYTIHMRGVSLSECFFVWLTHTFIHAFYHIHIARFKCKNGSIVQRRRVFLWSASSVNVCIYIRPFSYIDMRYEYI